MSEICLEDYSLIPKEYKAKDPRSLLYLYPNSINIVSYAKQMQKFSFYQSLKIAEDLVKRQGYILLPWECIHWERAKNLSAERKIKIGRKSFFFMRLHELTKNEKLKLENYLREQKIAN